MHEDNKKSENQITKHSLPLLFMLVEFRYMTRKFKLLRFNEKKVEIDIEGILGNMKINLEKGITPLNKQVKEFSSKANMVICNL